MARRSLINWLNDSNWRHQWNDAVLKDTSLYPLAALFIYGVLFYLLPIFFPLTRQWHGLPQFYFLVAALVILKKTHRSLNNIGLRREGILKEIAIGLLVSLVPLAVVAILLLQHNTPLSLVPAHFVQDLNLRLHRPAYLYQLFLLLLLAPLTEELFFRGVLTELLRSRLQVWLLIPLVAGLFAAAHFNWQVGPFLLGLATTSLYLMRRSIVAGMVLHCLCNLLGPLLVLWSPEVYRELHLFFL